MSARSSERNSQSTDQNKMGKNLQECENLANMHFTLTWRVLEGELEHTPSKEVFKHLYLSAFMMGWTERLKQGSLELERRTEEAKQETRRLETEIAKERTCLQKSNEQLFAILDKTHQVQRKTAEKVNTIECWEIYATALEGTLQMLGKLFQNKGF